MQNFIKKIGNNFEEFICSIMLGYIAISLNIEVFSRYILNSPSAYTDEVSRILMICIVFLGTSLAIKKKRHVVIDVLPNLSIKASFIINIIADGIFIIFCSLFIFTTLRAVSFHKMLGTTTDGLGLSFWILLSILPFSFSISIIRLIQSITESYKEFIVITKPGEQK